MQPITISSTNPFAPLFFEDAAQSLLEDLQNPFSSKKEKKECVNRTDPNQLLSLVNQSELFLLGFSLLDPANRTFFKTPFLRRPETLFNLLFASANAPFPEGKKVFLGNCLLNLFNQEEKNRLVKTWQEKPGPIKLFSVLIPLRQCEIASLKANSTLPATANDAELVTLILALSQNPLRQFIQSSNFQPVRCLELLQAVFKREQNLNHRQSFANNFYWVMKRSLSIEEMCQMIPEAPEELRPHLALSFLKFENHWIGKLTPKQLTSFLNAFLPEDEGMIKAFTSFFLRHNPLFLKLIDKQIELKDDTGTFTMFLYQILAQEASKEVGEFEQLIASTLNQIPPILIFGACQDISLKAILIKFTPYLSERHIATLSLFMKESDLAQVPLPDLRMTQAKVLFTGLPRRLRQRTGQTLLSVVEKEFIACKKAHKTFETATEAYALMGRFKTIKERNLPLIKSVLVRRNAKRGLLRISERMRLSTESYIQDISMQIPKLQSADEETLSEEVGLRLNLKELKLKEWSDLPKFGLSEDKDFELLGAIEKSEGKIVFSADFLQRVQNYFAQEGLAQAWEKFNDKKISSLNELKKVKRDLKCEELFHLKDINLGKKHRSK